jgi:tRNA (guanine37-N1)-methyltransferase
MGEQTRKALLEVGLLDIAYVIIKEDGFLYLPLSEKPETQRIHDLLDMESIELGEREFSPTNEGPSTLADSLDTILNREQLELLPRAYDLVGDIAVLEIPEELTQFSEQIGEAFLKVHQSFSTVLGKKGAIAGQTRVREYSLLAGEDKTDTIHTEYGCRIRVDLTKAYFSPRLLEEHHQVAEQVSDKEIVVDMFTGVGPFAIHIAKRCRANIVAIDINPEAIALLEESMKLNKLLGEVTPVCADAHDYVRNNFDKNAHRIIMNHPSGSYEFITEACHALAPGGILHFYEFAGGEDPEREFRARISNLIESTDRRIDTISRVRRVRDSAPYEYQMVADIRLR